MKPTRRRLLAALTLLAAPTLRAAADAAEAERIEQLLRFVEAQQQVRFVRNGSAYSSREAAQFLRAKYAKMGGQVATAAQFIEQIASRSSTSGRPYLMRFPDGRTLPSAQVLSEELERIARRP